MDMRGMTFSHYIRLGSEKSVDSHFGTVVIMLSFITRSFQIPRLCFSFKISFPLRRQVNLTSYNFNTLEFAANFIGSCNIIVVKDNWMTTIPNVSVLFLESDGTNI